MSTATQRNNNEESGLHGMYRYPFLRTPRNKCVAIASRDRATLESSVNITNLRQKLSVTCYFLFFELGGAKTLTSEERVAK